MTIKEQLVKIFNISFAVIFYYIVILAIGKMNLQSPVSGMILIPFLYLLYRLVKYADVHLTYNAVVWWIRQGVSFVIMVIMVYQLRVAVSWDWGQLLRTAHHYTMTGEIDNPAYYMQYPNNHFWLVCLIAIFRFVFICTSSTDFAVYKGASMMAGIFLMQGTFWLTFRIARHLWHDGRAVFAGISVLCYVPFYQYAMFLYTDVPGICIAVLFLYCAVLFEKCNERSKKVFYAGAIGILASLAIYIKLTAFIVFVAIMIAYLMKYKIKMMVLYGSIAGIFLLLGSTVIGSLIDHTLQFDRSEALRHEFPPTHWIMMMLNTSGGFYQEDVDYTKSYTTYEDKVSANIGKIKERIVDRGAEGTIKHILYTKQVRTWTDSCIAGDDYVSRRPINEQTFCQKIFSQNGKWHGFCLLYTWLVHSIILSGLVLSAVLSCKKKVAEQKMLAGRIAVFGLFLFLSVWECNSRYLFVMIPIMMLVSADGMFSLYDRYCCLLKNKHREQCPIDAMEM